jgi:hypothetical protein
MLNESLQLIFQICGLLSGKAWFPMPQAPA